MTFFVSPKVCHLSHL